MTHNLLPPLPTAWGSVLRDTEQRQILFRVEECSSLNMIRLKSAKCCVWWMWYGCLGKRETKSYYPSYLYPYFSRFLLLYVSCIVLQYLCCGWNNKTIFLVKQRQVIQIYPLSYFIMSSGSVKKLNKGVGDVLSKTILQSYFKLNPQTDTHSQILSPRCKSIINWKGCSQYKFKWVWES